MGATTSISTSLRFRPAGNSSPQICIASILLQLIPRKSQRQDDRMMTNHLLLSSFHIILVLQHLYAFFMFFPVRCHSGLCSAARIPPSRGFGGVPVAASLRNSWLQPWGDEDAAGHRGNVVFVRFGLLWHHHFYSHHLDAHVHYRQVRLEKLTSEYIITRAYPSFRFCEAVSSQKTRHFQWSNHFTTP